MDILYHIGNQRTMGFQRKNMKARGRGKLSSWNDTFYRCHKKKSCQRLSNFVWMSSLEDQDFFFNYFVSSSKWIKIQNSDFFATSQVSGQKWYKKTTTKTDYTYLINFFFCDLIGKPLSVNFLSNDANISVSDAVKNTLVLALNDILSIDCNDVDDCSILEGEFKLLLLDLY